MFRLARSNTLSLNISLLKKNYYISISTRGVIGQFWGPYFTIRPAKFGSCSINLREVLNILLNNVFSVRTVSYGSSLFPLIYGPRDSCLGHTESTSQNIEVINRESSKWLVNSRRFPPVTESWSI